MKNTITFEQLKQLLKSKEKEIEPITISFEVINGRD